MRKQSRRKSERLTRYGRRTSTWAAKIATETIITPKVSESMNNITF